MPRKVTVKVNNINLIFNKLYYEQLTPGNSKQFEEDVKKKNEMIFLQKFKDSDFSACQELEEHFAESFKRFRLKTDYPGCSSERAIRTVPELWHRTLNAASPFPMSRVSPISLHRASKVFCEVHLRTAVPLSLISLVKYSKTKAFVTKT